MTDSGGFFTRRAALQRAARDSHDSQQASVGRQRGTNTVRGLLSLVQTSHAAGDPAYLSAAGAVESRRPGRGRLEPHVRCHEKGAMALFQQKFPPAEIRDTNIRAGGQGAAGQSVVLSKASPISDRTDLGP